MSLQCQCQIQRLCFAKDLFTYVCMRVYVHIYKEHFSKTFISELGIGIAILTFGLALNVFGKKALHDIYIYSGLIIRFILIASMIYSASVWKSSNNLFLISLILKPCKINVLRTQSMVHKDCYFLIPHHCSLPEEHQATTNT